MGSKKKSNEDPNHTNGETSEGGHGGNTDSRFASVFMDPRFASGFHDKGKFTLDPRFDIMLIDPSFSSSSTAHIDKRGKAKKDSSLDALKRYYRLEEDEEEKLKRKEDVESEEDSDEREVESEKPSVDLSDDSEMGTDSEAFGTDEGRESKDEYSADTEEEDEYGLASAEEEEDTFVQEENVSVIDKETHRLAVVNLDWGRVKAVDLYVLLSSFVPKGGQVLSVAVYPSELGLQRMEEEAVHGPVGLFDDEKDKKGSDDDDGEIDNEKLRAYELSRLSYYNAVVECDSIATADHLFKNCDGVELERSSNKLDLRFIPDSMEFKHSPRDVAKEAPADYEGLDFQTRALQQTNIDLTWDEDEPHRVRTLKRKFNAEQLADMEMKDFLASDESETDDDENNETEDRSEKKHKNKDIYRDLLQSGKGSDEGDEDGGQDMVVTFNTGLENLSQRIVDNKNTESETIWEQRLRKMREKKKARKNRAKNSSEDESDGEPAEEMDDFFIDESSAKKDKKGKNNNNNNKKKKKKKKKKNDEDKVAEEKWLAELELIAVGEEGADAGAKGYKMKKRKKDKKGKKGKENPNEGKRPTMDYYEDPRFSSILKSPLFALDPTDPQYKRSAAAFAWQRQRVGGEEEASGHEDTAARPAQLETDDMATSEKERKDKHELSCLVKCIKMKSKEAKKTVCR